MNLRAQARNVAGSGNQHGGYRSVLLVERPKVGYL